MALGAGRPQLGARALQQRLSYSNGCFLVGGAEGLSGVPGAKATSFLTAAFCLQGEPGTAGPPGREGLPGKDVSVALWGWKVTHRLNHGGGLVATQRTHTGPSQNEFLLAVSAWTSQWSRGFSGSDIIC